MNFFILIGLFLVVKTSIACSFYVNESFQKNLLIAHGASHMDIDLTKVSETKVSAYKQIMTSSSGGSSCPDYLEAEAVINLKYGPNEDENCEAELTVHRKEFIGKMPTGPMAAVSYAGVSASCSTVSKETPIIKPIKYYRVSKRPFPF